MSHYLKQVLLNGLLYCGPIAALGFALVCMEEIQSPGYRLAIVGVFITTGLLGARAAEDKLLEMDRSPSPGKLFDQKHRTVIACVSIVSIAVVLSCYSLKPYRYAHTRGFMVLDKRTGRIVDGREKNWEAFPSSPDEDMDPR